MVCDLGRDRLDMNEREGLIFFGGGEQNWGRGGGGAGGAESVRKGSF